MVLFVLRKLILQTRMRGHPVWLDVWFLVGSFVYIHTSCVRTAKALARLRACAGSPEPSLVAYVISTMISWADSIANFNDEHTISAVNTFLLDTNTLSNHSSLWISPGFTYKKVLTLLQLQLENRKQILKYTNRSSLEEMVIPGTKPNFFSLATTFQLM